MIINDKNVLKEHIIVLKKLSSSQMALMEALAICFEKINSMEEKKTDWSDLNG